MKNSTTLTLLAFLLLASMPAFGQRPREERPKPKPRQEITEMVKDLSSSQKSRLDAISKESKVRLDRLHSQQEGVRDSIAALIELEGDHSRELYPLFDREARLQTEISREMYATKLRFDEVLTKEQRREMQANSKRQHRPHQRKK